MSDKRRGLGRGLGALIPPPPAARPAGDRPVDTAFFNERQDGDAPAEAQKAASEGAPATSADTKLTDSKSADSSGEQQPTTTSGDASADTEAAKAEELPPVQAKTPDLVPVPGAYFTELPVGAIVPNPRQPRTVFDEEAMTELVHSVKEIGVLQPIVVRSVPAAEAGGATSYQLIMGERRWRASTLAGLEHIPAIVRDTNDDDLLRDALLENLHRSELNPLEEAAAYQQLLDDFGCTHEVLATRIGRSRPQISNTIRLLRLPPAVQRRVAAGVLSAGHARALLGLENAEAMDKLATRIVGEGLSVRATEEAVAISEPSDEAAPSARRKPRAGNRNVELDDLAGRLADKLDTRVSIALGRTKGKLSVEFASVDDLNRILDILAPETRKAFQNGE
ncbi:ParB/RepB/Spo0J family partition protein [Kineosporia sp. J2-2]|uniref:ParB/RepB/Spo0J family partition protein n=1 Tax=Kineosporia corallincola TaxID=2835133 RepID=A0ABS5TJJ9_9ACTN|nr:ParB/RepB/Spo0J family partition protein [Kineosporia corallincola]MBT0771272.1 ParB/RepB/Spo0J family partition protein [Kineosporia corallincola]